MRRLLLLLMLYPFFIFSQTNIIPRNNEIVIALDLSNSMLCEDIKPNRLLRSKQVISELIDNLEGERIGLVIFAGEAYIRLPITSDYSAAKMFLSTINIRSIKTQGTNLSEAIQQSVKCFNFENEYNKSIIIITDGEDHEKGAITEANKAAEKGLFIHTLAIGSENGGPIPFSKGRGYRKDREGNIIVTKPNFVFLSELANIGNGININANNSKVGLKQLFNEISKTEKEISSHQEIKGIDIIIAMDISGSMLAQDLKPNRLDASKKIAIDFISKRKNDRIGLVVFSRESFTQCPLTTDYNTLINLFNDIEYGMVDDGTAIGDGLVNSINRLIDSDAKSKIVILLTDGENTKGMISPLTAADIAEKYGIRVYTIGVGTKGIAKSPVAIDFNGKFLYDLVEVKIDEKTLKEIANKTGGEYFRATDNKSLKVIYNSIDKIETSKYYKTITKKDKEEQKENKDQNQENNQQNLPKEELSKEEIEQILNALEREEKEVQEDLQEKRVIGVTKLLKDW